MAMTAGKGADDDVEIGIAIETDPAQRPGIGAAPPGFQLVDDLHCTNLGRARDRTSGEGRAQQVNNVETGFQFGRDLRNLVEDGWMGFYGKEFRNLDCAGDGDPAKVIALKIDDHQ